MSTQEEISLPKYRRVVAALRDRIDQGAWKSGDRIPGEHALAAEFEIAYMTVRHAVDIMVADGTLLRVRGKGTFVAERGGKVNDPADNRTVRPMSIVFPTDWLRRDPYYFPEILDGFQRSMEQVGFTAGLLNDDAAESLLPERSAVACLLISADHCALVNRLADLGHAVLAINLYSGRRRVPSVYIDDRGGIIRAVEHLVKLGHRHIGYVSGPADNLDAAQRVAGFREAARSHRLTTVIESGEDFSEPTGYHIGQRMLASASRPTAIVCASDLAAIGVVQAAREMDIVVPRMLSVVGFGDFTVGDYIHPRMTTVKQNRTDLGVTAARSLVRLAEGVPVVDVLLGSELIVRDSTAVPINAA